MFHQLDLAQSKNEERRAEGKAILRSLHTLSHTISQLAQHTMPVSAALGVLCSAVADSVVVMLRPRFATRC